jgi:mycothiol synthase
MAEQLTMIWPAEATPKPPSHDLSSGYLLRTWTDGDAQPYLRLMNRAGFDSWSMDTLQKVLRKALPGGLYFAVQKSTGVLAATAVATHSPLPRFPFGGELGWVAADPDHRGRGLGRAVCAAVTLRLLESRYRNIYLLTDDFRLPAIRIYLELGWIPSFSGEEMESRWRCLSERLGIDLGADFPMRKRRERI